MIALLLHQFGDNLTKVVSEIINDRAKEIHKIWEKIFISKYTRSLYLDRCTFTNDSFAELLKKYNKF